jgi:hypothetical protein
MTDSDGGFPRRDAHRRIVAVRDLVAMAMAAVVVGAVALTALDLAFAALGLGEFGGVNGWLAAIPTVMLLIEEFRAWRGVPGRLAVAAVGAVVAVGAGLLVAGVAGDLPRLVAGAIGAVTFTAVYAPLWFYGIRFAGGRTGEGVR